MTLSNDDKLGSLLDKINDFVDRIAYKENYEFIVNYDGDGVYVQVSCWRPDCFTGEMGWGFGGKGYVKETITDSELARLCFGLIKAYEEHECREAFKIDGVQVFGPHIHLNALLEAGKRLEHME